MHIDIRLLIQPSNIFSGKPIFAPTKTICSILLKLSWNKICEPDGTTPWLVKLLISRDMAASDLCDGLLSIWWALSRTMLKLHSSTYCAS